MKGYHGRANSGPSQWKNWIANAHKYRNDFNISGDDAHIFDNAAVLQKLFNFIASADCF